MKIVGTNHGGYANERNISGLPFQKYKVVRCRNFYRAANYLHFKLRGQMHRYYPFLHWDAGFSNYDLLHFFNGISLGNRPWISTFETFLPRWAAYGGKRIDWGLRKLAGPACKRLIALSACTQEIQRQFLQDHAAFADEINAKVSVLQPSQRLLLGPMELDAKLAEPIASKGSIRCLFVGADFFRKGGLEMLQAMDILLQSGAALSLDIVSAMQGGDYASHSTDRELELAMAIIARHPNQMVLHRSLPNADVLALCRKADLGLLPTWADTYGYSALEFMAAGCPVISSDIRALPEINGPDRGWLIPCSKDSWGNALIGSTAERADFSKRLRESLVETLSGILQQPDVVQEKGRRAYSHVQTHHAPANAATTLEKWYDEALG